MKNQIEKISLPIWNQPENINEAQIRILDLGKNIHEHAYLVGKDLIWVRDKIGTTKFENWMENNLWFGERTAYHFMAFAKKCDHQGYLLEYHPGKRISTTATIAVIPGTYRTIVIDPPWPIEKIERTERPYQEPNLDYPTMKIEAIKEIKLPIAKNGCHIYLWTTDRFLKSGEAEEVFEAWGVKLKTHLIWHKNVGFTPFGIPFQIRHEFVLFGTVGQLEELKKGEATVFIGKVREHSRKPDEFYDLVKKVSPEPRIDIFSREKRDGFEQWGNEIDKFQR